MDTLIFFGCLSLYYLFGFCVCVWTCRHFPSFRRELLYEVRDNYPNPKTITYTPQAFWSFSAFASTFWPVPLGIGLLVIACRHLGWLFHIIAIISRWVYRRGCVLRDSSACLAFGRNTNRFGSFMGMKLGNFFHRIFGQDITRRLLGDPGYPEDKK